MKHRINEVLPIPSHKNEPHDWGCIESEIGFIFPDDYKTLIDNYGGGGINEFLWILSPFTKCKNLNMIEKYNEMKAAFCQMKTEFPEMLPFDFYDGKQGLFPWGITDNGDELYWHLCGTEVGIVVFESRYSSYQTFNIDVTDFLYGLLTKQIICSAFPLDFVVDANYYEVIL